jgi:hypothetical protein
MQERTEIKKKGMAYVDATKLLSIGNYLMNSYYQDN